MAIDLPKFEYKYGQILTACGKLKGIELKGLVTKKPKLLIARYRTSAGNAFVRVRLADTKGAKYLHVDCALEHFLPKDKKPEVTHKKEEVLKIIESFLGVEIDYNVDACFEVPFKELPENGLIRSLSTEQKTTDMTVRLTGADLSMSGAPIKKIRWTTRKKERQNVINVWMRAERSTSISDKYLSETLEWISKQFAIFVLGKKENANT